MSLGVKRTNDFLEFDKKLSSFDFEEVVDELADLDLYPYSESWGYIYIVDTQNYKVYEGNMDGRKFERCNDSIANEILEDMDIDRVHWVDNNCIVFNSVGIFVFNDEETKHLTWEDIIKWQKS